ncbi:MAG: hypothetical protein ACK4SN_16265 [Bellilinea sp.]
MSIKNDLVIEGLEKFIELIEQSGDLREEVYFPIHDTMAQAGKLLEEQIKQNLTRVRRLQPCPSQNKNPDATPFGIAPGAYLVSRLVN